MLVRLAFTFAPHRAHIVQGILAAHGVSSWVWFEQAVHFYVPGAFGCAVMINEDDIEDAREIMMATCEEELPQSDTANEMKAFKVLPDFITCALAAFLAILTSVALGFLFNKILIIVTGRAMPGWDPISGKGLEQVLVFSPPLALTFAALVWFFFLPMRVFKDSPWMGLLAYLWVRVCFPFAIIIMIGLLHLLRLSW